MPAFCRLALLALLPLLLPSCMVVQKGQDLPPSLEGPPLAIAGEQGERFFSGSMDRACMLGQGEMKLQSEGLACTGSISVAPNKSGHVGGLLKCADGGRVMLSFRNLGPDQGIGIGRLVTPASILQPEPLIFYYHPWDEEARRRLAQEKSTMLELISRKSAKQE